MGYGLGKNSPIVLSLGKSNFEALIERHGQWLRWRTAKKCPCVTENNRHNIHCPRCGGSGDIYDYQREYDDSFRAVVRGNIIQIPEEFENASVLEVYDAYGKKYEFCQLDDYIQIKNANIKQSSIVEIKIRVSIVKKLEAVTLEKVGGGYYRVPGILTEPSKLEGVYYQAAGDVIAAENLLDADDNPVNAMGYRRDMILTDSNSNAVVAGSVEYVMPFRFRR